MRKVKDLAGAVFGRLTVVERCGSDAQQKSSMWLCQCQCGNIVIVSRNNLRSGHTRSCGCLKKEFAFTAGHGQSDTRLYRIWTLMKDRCENHNTPNFENYGGRGIKVCEEWRNSFEAFMRWSMKNGYSEGLSIDRIDVNGNYCPENCRWATWKEQQNNRRDNHFITYNGRTQTISQWSEETGINQATLLQRINKLNWSIERALEETVTQV